MCACPQAAYNLLHVNILTASLTVMVFHCNAYCCIHKDRLAKCIGDYFTARMFRMQCAHCMRACLVVYEPASSGRGLPMEADLLVRQAWFQSSHAVQADGSVRGHDTSPCQGPQLSGQTPTTVLLHSLQRLLCSC